MSLRGTRKRINKWYNAPRPPTLQNQITSLRRQVNKNRAETLYHRSFGSINSNPGGGLLLTNLLPTDNLITSGSFRDNVTGDRWVNKVLKLRFYVEPDCNKFRVVMYIPKKAGNRFTPSNFCAIPDPSAFTVHRDFLMNTNDRDDINRSDTRLSYSPNINFKSRQSVYNSDSGILERGELVVLIMTDGVDILGGKKQYEYGYQLVYSNK